MTLTTLRLEVNADGDISVAAPGEGNGYPSYASVAEADAYLIADVELAVDWLALSAVEKVQRLVSATRRLDRLKWRGERAGGASQATAWPRSGLQYPGGGAVGSDAPPDEIEDVAILLAGDLSFDLAATAGGREEQVRSLTAGRIQESFFFEQLSQLERLMPGGTLDLIRYWLQSEGTVTKPTVTGRDKNAPSEFSERYEREFFRRGNSGY